MPDVLTGLDLNKMELLVGSELRKGINNFINDLTAVIEQLQIQGVSETQIKIILLDDLNSGGRLFGSLKNGMKTAVSTAIGQASNDASMEVFASVKEFRWIAISLSIGKQPCPDCRPRHGRIEPRSTWRNIGMPKSGFSVCQRYCKCRLVPSSYKGKGLEVPLVRKAKS